MKKLAILLTIALLIGSLTGCHASQLSQVTEESTEVVLGIEEEKIYCTATLEDDFADDCVLVVITNIASLKLKTYTPEDFPEIQCVKVDDISTATKDQVQTILRGEPVRDALGMDYNSFDIEDYHMILVLTLNNPGKQNVLDAIKELEKREDVLAAEPDYAVYLID